MPLFLYTMCVQCLQEPEEGIRSPEPVFWTVVSPICGGWESNSGPLKGQLVPLTTEPPPIPVTNFKKRCLIPSNQPVCITNNTGGASFYFFPAPDTNFSSFCMRSYLVKTGFQFDTLASWFLGLQVCTNMLGLFILYMCSNLFDNLVTPTTFVLRPLPLSVCVYSCVGEYIFMCVCVQTYIEAKGEP